MSFDKSFKNRKDWRKDYHDSRRFDRSCRNHGACDYCTDNRLFSAKKRKMMFSDTMHNFEFIDDFIPSVML